MTNFIFKSSTDLQKIRQQLLVILNEQKHQRSDLAIIRSMIQNVINSSNLQKQVDEYFEETSPQTDSENNDSDAS